MDYQFSEALAGMHGTATREIYRVLSRPGIISLAGGSPAHDCLPYRQIEEIAAELFADHDLMTKGYRYGTTEGFPELRELVLGLAASFGINISGMDTGNAIITSGGGQSIDLILKTFVNRGDTVLAENPTYQGFLQTAQSYGAVIAGVDAGEDGLIIQDLEEKILRHKPKLLYVVPTFSNPTGKTYSAANRKAIVELALRYGVMVAEDDPYSRLRISGEAVPPLKVFDTNNTCVVYISSFSKVVSPGIRLGFSIGPAEVIRKMTIAKQGVDLSSSNISQLLIQKYLERGYYYPNIEKSLPIYRERKGSMFEALGKYFPEEFSHTDPDGGIFIWGEFRTPIDTAAMFSEALKRNVVYIEGRSFFADGRGRSSLRLNFSNETPENIDKAVRILGELSKMTIAACEERETPAP
ncbi:MAG: PLP-dependent aminotransferase family protein [Spirochaetaceae bacterium]|jgi:2-aminoadipate transaminase|nr:PLP-dependent aminotransferase family protein [Spirochaetaceae bacterium]